MDSNDRERNAAEREILRALFHWKNTGMLVESMEHYFPNSKSFIPQLIEKGYMVIETDTEKDKSLYHITDIGRIAIKTKSDKELGDEYLIAQIAVMAIKSSLIQWDNSINSRCYDLEILLGEIHDHMAEYEKNINADE